MVGEKSGHGQELVGDAEEIVSETEEGDSLSGDGEHLCVFGWVVGLRVRHFI